MVKQAVYKRETLSFVTVTRNDTRRSRLFSTSVKRTTFKLSFSEGDFKTIQLTSILYV